MGKASGRARPPPPGVGPVDPLPSVPCGLVFPQSWAKPKTSTNHQRIQTKGCNTPENSTCPFLAAYLCTPKSLQPRQAKAGCRISQVQDSTVQNKRQHKTAKKMGKMRETKIYTARTSAADRLFSKRSAIFFSAIFRMKNDVMVCDGSLSLAPASRAFLILQ